MKNRGKPRFRAGRIPFGPVRIPTPALSGSGSGGLISGLLRPPPTDNFIAPKENRLPDRGGVCRQAVTRSLRPFSSAGIIRIRFGGIISGLAATPNGFLLCTSLYENGAKWQEKCLGLPGIMDAQYIIDTLQTQTTNNLLRPFS